MAENPRIAELQKKLEKDPASRLFAQLAEELRKEGRFDEAIGICRKGLEKNSNYPSARLTLARALLDSGIPREARAELEHIVKASPDNILASRLLGDALEDVGEFDQARRQFEQTLRLSPGDKAIIEKIAELKAKLATTAAVLNVAPAAAVPFPSISFGDDAPAPSVFDTPATVAAIPALTMPSDALAVPAAPVAAPPVVASEALDRDLAAGTAP